MAVVVKQAESRGLSAFIACTWHHACRFCARAGPSSSNAAPAGARRDGARDRARHQPRSSYRGVTGRSPVRRGSERRKAARAQGKAFPSTNPTTFIGDHVGSDIAAIRLRQGPTYLAKASSKMETRWRQPHSHAALSPEQAVPFGFTKY